MSITTIFTKLGHVGGVINAVNATVGTTIPGKINTLVGDYSSSQAEVDGIYRTLTAYQATANGILAAMQQLGNAVILGDVNVAEGLPSATSVTAGIVQLIADMISGSATVNACTVGSSISAGGSNTGNPRFVLSTKLPSGVAAEHLFDEVILGLCSRDSQSGGATARRETVSFQGQPAAQGALAYNWPAGSGSNSAVQLVDSAQGQQTTNGNMLNGSDFEVYTVANIPDNWHIGTGTAGTTVLKSTAPYVGTNALSFVGNGSELTAVYQAFGSDTSPTVKPLTQYAANLWIKVSSVPSAGVIEVALTDGSGTIIDDAEGNANSFTVSLPGASTSYAPFSGTFRTPRVLPAVVRLRARLSTALDNTKTVFMDSLAMTPMAPIYTGGVSVAGFAGNANPIAGDSYTITATNDYAGLLQMLANRLFNLRQNGLILPSSGSPSLSDSLVT